MSYFTCSAFVNKNISRFKSCALSLSFPLSVILSDVKLIPFGDITSITENLISMSKEMAKMEAEIFELKQKQAISQEIKSVLDAWVRHEGQLREREQRLIAEQVLARVMTGLEDPKLVHS